MRNFVLADTFKNCYLIFVHLPTLMYCYNWVLDIQLYRIFIMDQSPSKLSLLEMKNLGFKSKIT